MEFIACLIICVLAWWFVCVGLPGCLVVSLFVWLCAGVFVCVSGCLCGCLRVCLFACVLLQGLVSVVRLCVLARLFALVFVWLRACLVAWLCMTVVAYVFVRFCLTTLSALPKMT